MQAVKLTGKEIAGHIGNAGESCILIVPGVDEEVAQALRARSRPGCGHTRVVIDGTHHAERSGYGETAQWRGLMETVAEFRTMPGTRLGLLATDRGVWLFASPAGKLDAREEAGLNAVELGPGSRQEALEMAGRLLADPAAEREAPGVYREDDQEAGRVPPSEDGEPRAAGEITEKQVEEAEKAIEEHPPRDYAREHAITVYSAYVGYIELRLVGASLAKGQRLKIPKELVERGLTEDEVRKRIAESVRIDLTEEEDLGVREINERLNALRTLYTRQLGPPHGRIYRKRHLPAIREHVEDLGREIDRANKILSARLDAAVREEIGSLAETWSNQPGAEGSRPLSQGEVHSLLLKEWNQAGRARPREVRLEVTYKDLTWESLRDDELKARIVDAFPALEDSALHKEVQAHAGKEGS